MSLVVFKSALPGIVITLRHARLGWTYLPFVWQVSVAANSGIGCRIPAHQPLPPELTRFSSASC
ncbi:MAG: hypothetical protein IPH23_04770 [Gammaproteobacteria bacterium]|nr:hypothetical protein [Gammaproteobacteria bacterium]